MTDMKAANVSVVVISLVISLAAMAAAPVMAEKTATFTDVTSTHVPSDAYAHVLDAEFGDVDQDGDLDVVLALEFDARRTAPAPLPR